MMDSTFSSRTRRSMTLPYCAPASRMARSSRMVPPRALPGIGLRQREVWLASRAPGIPQMDERGKPAHASLLRILCRVLSLYELERVPMLFCEDKAVLAYLLLLEL